ncbi:sulfatase/phosphatase domain-containing protein, partial [Marinovum sp. F03]
LAATGRAGTTAVIYSSVVGDQFKFRDAVNRGGHTCYDDCIRVPLVIRGPGGPAGVRLAQIVGLHDLAPTIAAMAGADLADADGESLLPLMAGRPTAWRRALYIHNRHLRHIAVTFEAEKGRAYYGTFPSWDQRAIWTGRHKLILSFDKGRHSLFDTCIDPEEEFDLFGAPHRRTPMDELTRFKDTMPLVRELAQEMAALAERVGDRAGADLAREIARSADPLHRPAGTPFHHL